MNRDYRLYIRDILDCIHKIEEFVGDMQFEEFRQDDKTSSEVARKIEIIGEASKNVPESIKKKFPGIPWKDMARMRDKVIHFYFGIDYEIVWKVIKEKLPSLLGPMTEVLNSINGKSGKTNNKESN